MEERTQIFSTLTLSWFCGNVNSLDGPYGSLFFHGISHCRRNSGELLLLCVTQVGGAADFFICPQGTF